MLIANEEISIDYLKKKTKFHNIIYQGLFINWLLFKYADNVIFSDISLKANFYLSKMKFISISVLHILMLESSDN